MEIDDEQVPIELLIKRGWLDAKMTVTDLLRRFESPSGSQVRFRHTQSFGSNSRTSPAHVWLWLARVRELADAQKQISERFRRDKLDDDLIRYVSRLSYMANGPRLAKEFLEENGIVVVIEPHLPKTHLDGAAMLGRHGTPVIGITIREDRLDNFWFTLIHELIHAWKHLDGSNRRAIVDENIERRSDSDEIEQEANNRATDIFIPRAIWRRSQVFLDPTAEAIKSLAVELKISPAIIAGRVRYERQDYKLFSKLVGYRQARSNFPEIRWT
jgi:HTH-type transcriptional regulator/antitoxin HigA